MKALLNSLSHYYAVLCSLLRDSPSRCGPSDWACSQTRWRSRCGWRLRWLPQTRGHRGWRHTENVGREKVLKNKNTQTKRWAFKCASCGCDVTITWPTSLQPRTVNSLTVRMSSMSRFISLSLSEKPTRMKRPLGCRATLCASSWNSLYSSNNLVTEHRGGAMERHGSVSSACHTLYKHDTEHMAR